MPSKNIEQLKIIKKRMLEAGISIEEVLTLVTPLEEELERRVCGLVWEHTTTSIPDLEGKIPALIPVKEKNIVQENAENNHILIEGENLLTLMAMQYTHINDAGEGIVDVIYIDPPYNTGSISFAYNDKFEKSEWLSMMDIRLKLARNLLKDDGVIFIQIDEGYQAELKLLMNDIFGQDKHAVTIHVEMSATQGMKVKSAQSGTIVKNAEYILAYTKDGHKNIARTLLYDYRPEYDKHYNKMLLKDDTIVDLKDEYNRRFPGCKIANLSEYKTNTTFNKFVSENAESIFRYDKTTGFIVADYKPGEIYRVNRNGRKYTIIVKNNKVAQLLFLSDSYGKCDDSLGSFGLRKIRGDLWKDFYKDMGNVSKEGKIVFENGKKPIRLLKQLIKMTTNQEENFIVLDFFAGSGTTGHAVMELNKEDGGNRQFILCTNNELGKEAKKTAKKNGYEEGSEEYESLGVCHAVTYPRMTNIFPDYPGNNLYYYKIEPDIEESAIDEVTIANMTEKAVSYVALKENIFETEEYEDFCMLKGEETEIIIVTDPDMDMYDAEKFAEKFEKERRKIYCSVYERTFRGDVEFIPYPEEVLETLKDAKKIIRREAR